MKTVAPGLIGCFFLIGPDLSPMEALLLLINDLKRKQSGEFLWSFFPDEACRAFYFAPMFHRKHPSFSDHEYKYPTHLNSSYKFPSHFKGQCKNKAMMITWKKIPAKMLVSPRFPFRPFFPICKCIV